MERIRIVNFHAFFFVSIEQEAGQQTGTAGLCCSLLLLLHLTFKENLLGKRQRLHFVTGV
jgi:hypothetical protein